MTVRSGASGREGMLQRREACWIAARQQSDLMLHRCQAQVGGGLGHGDALFEV